MEVTRYYEFHFTLIYLIASRSGPWESMTLPLRWTGTTGTKIFPSMFNSCHAQLQSHVYSHFSHPRNFISLHFAVQEDLSSLFFLNCPLCLNCQCSFRVHIPRCQLASYSPKLKPPSYADSLYTPHTHDTPHPRLTFMGVAAGHVQCSCFLNEGHFSWSHTHLRP